MTAHIPEVDSCYAADLTLRSLPPPPSGKSRSRRGRCVNTVPSEGKKKEGARAHTRAARCCRKTRESRCARPAAPLSTDSLLLRLSCDTPPPSAASLNGHTHFLAHIWSSSDTTRRCNLRSKIPLSPCGKFQRARGGPRGLGDRTHPATRAHSSTGT